MPAGSLDASGVAYVKGLIGSSSITGRQIGVYMVKALEMKGITKGFPGVLANDNVGLEVDKGKILAIVGENGAGKSTLMSILYGHYQPDKGEIFINGKKEDIDSPKRAIELGIGMVFQHFMLVPTLSVYENIILGLEPMKGISIDKQKAVEKCDAVVKQYGLNIDVTKKVGELPLGIQQRVEIIKALYRKAEILILDEPTAVLTPKETLELFATMKELTNQGKTILFITHKLDEVMAVADAITVLRKGKTISTVIKTETSKEELAQIMVGRKVSLKVDKKEKETGKTVVVAKDLCAEGKSRSGELKQLSFEIKQGEILGIAGIEGNGQTELLEVLTGLRKPKSGSVTVCGQLISGKKPREIRENKIIHIPEDRHKRGLVLNFSVQENLIAGIHYKKAFSTRHGFLKDAEISRHADDLIERFDIRGGGKRVPAGSLSGGNQQKIIIAREFSQEHEFLIASQPTRGVDVGAIEFIHQKILDSRDGGKAVLLISADLNEVMSLSDRIAVIFEGEFVDIIEAKDATEMQLGLMMSGSSRNSSAEGEDTANDANSKKI